MPKHLLIAADVDRAFMRLASADPRFVIEWNPARTEDDLVAIVAGCEILVTRAYNRVTRRVIDAATHLEVIAQGTSGVDNIDLDAAAGRGIAVLSLPGENANAVAEIVIGNLIALTRTVPFYARRMLAGDWPRDDCATRHELRHFRLGIAGLGMVGRRVARLAKAFGVRVRAYDPYITDGDFADRHADRAPELEGLLASSDILTLHVPLTPETRGMIGRTELETLPRGAYVINAARGEVLDVDAALDLLASGHLGGLALDVYDPEPPTRPWPDDPRLILTPHIAGCSHESKAAIGEKLYHQLVEWIGRHGRQRGLP